VIDATTGEILHEGYVPPDAVEEHLGAAEFDRGHAHPGRALARSQQR
jgi:hypothetical protein